MVLHRGNRVLELTRVLLRKQFTITFKKDKKQVKVLLFYRKKHETHTRLVLNRQKHRSLQKKKRKTGFPIFGKAPRIYDNGSNKRAKFTARWI